MTTKQIKKIDEWEIQGKNAELWIVKDNLQIRYLGTIHNIPLFSVSSKEKTGEWIDQSGGDPTDPSISCSLCNKWFTQSTNYCPNCGAKMINSQENYDKEE